MTRSTYNIKPVVSFCIESAKVFRRESSDCSRTKEPSCIVLKQTTSLRKKNLLSGLGLVSCTSYGLSEVYIPYSSLLKHLQFLIVASSRPSFPHYRAGNSYIY
ncbi:hypothetical protein Plhal304r1_c053g0138011 [Plasmopara halstedii]